MILVHIMILSKITSFITENYNDMIDKLCIERGTGNRLKIGRLKEKSLILRIRNSVDIEGRKCDCIIFSMINNNKKFAISIIELKSKSFKFSEAKEQIENCINLIKTKFLCQDIISALRGIKWDFLPILVSRSYPKIQNRAILSPANRIKFSTDKESRIVIKATYDDDLETIIKNEFRH